MSNRYESGSPATCSGEEVTGKPHNCNTHDLIYGGVVDAYSIIISATTKEESDRQIKTCAARIKEILA